MTDRLTPEQIEAVCGAAQRVADHLASTGNSYSSEMVQNAIETIRQLQNPWMPIETAPRDGTWILLTGGEIDYGWFNEHYVEDNDQPDCVVGQFVPGGGVWQFAWYDSGYYGEYETPTHYMPLPTPPKG